MRNDVYPQGTVLTLLNSDEVNEQTKKVLVKRLNGRDRISPTFFDDASFALLESICAVLFPKNEAGGEIPLAIMYEESLATGKGKGWRYNTMPPLKTAITQGLKGIEEEAQQVYQSSFAGLSTDKMEALLASVQQKRAVAEIWKTIPSNLFFEDLLASLTELYYSHPFAKDDIGDVSFSDAKGWTHLGLNNLEDREPLPLKTSVDATLS